MQNTAQKNVFNCHSSSYKHCFFSRNSDFIFVAIVVAELVLSSITLLIVSRTYI